MVCDIGNNRMLKIIGNIGYQIFSYERKETKPKEVLVDSAVLEKQ